MNENKNTQISLKHAIAWTALWREKCPKNCKAFSIPIQDLLGVLKEIGVLQLAGNTGLYLVDENTQNGVRAYMAIDPTPGMPGGGEKLLLVGTEPILDKHDKMVQRDIIEGRIDGQELINLLASADVTPDIILMDLKMPVLNGVETTKIVHTEYPDIKLLH